MNTNTNILKSVSIQSRELFLAVLDRAEQESASDIHFSGNGRIALRVNGLLVFLPYANIPVDLIEEIILRIVLKKENVEQFFTDKEFDCAYSDDYDRVYRCNVFYKNGRASLSMRCIERSVRTLETIGVPEKIKEFLAKKQGLILVCGPTGHGKTTTMAAMIDEINNTRQEHILTLEDPIEHVFESNRCMISQRELHTDTHSFEKSLRAAMRQDPDIIVIGEIRDRETAEAVFHLVSTGHLVITTMHATNAAQTLFRISRMFTAEEREMILLQLADTVLGILNQRLVPTIDGKRTAIFELMVADYATKNAIRNGDIAQLMNTLSTSVEKGMLPFAHSIRDLINQGKITREAVMPYIENEMVLH